jgi:hypothetical protein
MDIAHTNIGYVTATTTIDDDVLSDVKLMMMFTM